MERADPIAMSRGAIIGIALSAAIGLNIAVTASFGAQEVTRAEVPKQIERSPSQAKMKAQMYAYIRAMNTREKNAIIALYSDNATIEDPVGTPLMVGKAAIDEFYSRGKSRGIGADLVSQPVTSSTNTGAMAMKVHVGMLTPTAATINVIEVFTFTPEGKISSMKAYWGSEDREQLSPTRR